MNYIPSNGACTFHSNGLSFTERFIVRRALNAREREREFRKQITKTKPNIITQLYSTTLAKQCHLPYT